jgi:predicted thioesterase
VPIDDGAVGRRATVHARVDAALTADRYGNTGLEVLATPALVALFEQAAMRCLDGLMDPAEMSVGSRVEIVHAAPTALGREVAATARLAAVNGRELVFEVEATDDRGPIGQGTHSRFVVNAERFRARLATGPAGS